MTNAEIARGRAERMRAALNEAFAPCTIDLEDQSARHAGHSGARPEGETHFHLRLVSPAFEGQTRVERQRSVMKTLQKEFEGGLHALAMELRTPGET